MEFLDIFADGSRYREQVYELYEEAFPEAEKKPLELMENQVRQGKLEILAIAENEEFVGLAVNMLWENTALLDYFAIAPGKRSGGYGGRAVRTLTERFRNKKYIFEIEMQDSQADNAEERKRRKAFYLRNGLKETGLFVHAYDTDFELLTPDGSLNYERYVDFLQEIMGENINIVNPSLIAQMG